MSLIELIRINLVIPVILASLQCLVEQIIKADIVDNNYNLPDAQGRQEGGQEVLPPLHDRPEQRLQRAGEGIHPLRQK